MTVVCITGSTDGIGLAAAGRLLDQGHSVVLHARTQDRGRPVLDRLRAQGDARLVVGDLADLEQVAELADAVGEVDVLVHNAGVFPKTPGSRSAQGYELAFAVNALAPYVLTMLLQDVVRGRLVFLGSGMAGRRLDPAHLGEEPDPVRAYAESKALDVLQALAWARRLPGRTVGAVDPGWVATKLATPGAPGDVASGAARVAAAAVDDGWRGGYTAGGRPARTPRAVEDEDVQDAVMAALDAMARREA